MRSVLEAGGIPLILPQGIGAAHAAGVLDAIVNSLHQQGVRDLAPPLMATGWADDGLIEAFEGADDGWLVAVQWHPEAMHAEVAAPDMGLFRALVGATARP